MADTQEQALRRKQSKVAKYEGDDRHSWAFFVNGKPVYTGMAKNEATWRRDKYIKEGLK